MAQQKRRTFKRETSRGPVRQLMLLCAMLLLAILLMSRARDPRAWTWLTNLDATQQPAPKTPATNSSKSLLVRVELPPGVFVDSAGDARASKAGLIQSDSEAKDDPPAPLPEIDPAVFDGVRDKTRQIPRAAYFYLLDVARRAPPEELEDRAQRRVLTFAHFSAAPERYRGQPVFLNGHVRRMTEIKPIANREGFETVYEGWLFTEESQDNPYVLIVSRLPDNFPLGGDIVENVSFAGYFLKLWSYRADDGDPATPSISAIRYAPLLIGHRVLWHPRPQAPSVTATWHGLVIGGVAVLILALITVTWYARRSAAAIREMIVTRDRPTPTEVQSLGEGASQSTEEYLAKLERGSNEPAGEIEPRE
jgi:hypothetical protein